MPTRDKFPAHYFEGNPLAGETPEGAYKRLQWGNNPRRAWNIEGPEPMAALGRLAKLVYQGGKSQRFRDWSFFVAVGTRSNRVYLVPMDDRKRPVPFPRDFARESFDIGRVRQIDYYSEKGGERGYYYHEHERPYPMLRGCDDHFVLVPSRVNGGRSYAVNDEGIIG